MKRKKPGPEDIYLTNAVQRGIFAEMNNTINEKSVSLVADSTLLCVGLRVSGCETMH